MVPLPYASINPVVQTPLRFGRHNTTTTTTAKPAEVSILMWNDPSISWSMPMPKPEPARFESEKGQSVKQAYPRYRDFSSCSLETAKLMLSSAAPPPKNTKKGTFPTILYNLLMYAEENGHSDIVAWKSHGRAFQVKDKKRFSTWILPMFFHRQKSYPSFQRQLNIWGFLRLTKGGGYYHEVFLKGRPDLLVLLPRQRYTTCGVRQPFDTNSEPDLQNTMVPTCRSHGSTSRTVVPNASVVARSKPQDEERVPFPDGTEWMTFGSSPKEVVRRSDTNQHVEVGQDMDQSRFQRLAVPTCPSFALDDLFDASQSSSADMDFFEAAMHDSE